MSDPKPGTSWSDIPRAGWIALAIVIALAAASIIWAVARQGESTGSEAEAKSACHQFVERRLKAPGSANYGNEVASGSGSSWSVSGVVDSQNSFGAQIRNSFTCKTTLKSGDWSLDDLTLTEN